VVHATSVNLDEMRDQLLTLDQVRARLGTTEPLSQLTFPTASSINFTVNPGWADNITDAQPADVFLDTPAGTRYQLTRKAALEAGAQVGIPRGLQARMPSGDLVSLLNWWFRTGAGDKEFKLLSQDRANEDPLALAMCRGTITPFSNLSLLDIALEKIHQTYGAEVEVLADYKFHHDLELTTMRLIVPGASRTIQGSRVANDTWCAGIDIHNSLVGLKPTDIAGYLFRWWCTNGCTDTLTSTGQFSRRGAHDEADVWEWARTAVDAVLGGLESSFDSVQALTGIEMGETGEVTRVLRDLFSQYGIPVRERQRIIDSMADLTGTVTLYDVQQAITRAANMDGLAPRAVSQLLGMGGHIAHAATARCNSCRRLLPEGYVAPVPASGSVAELAQTN
jgi:hypothetical protein